jgi:hypothetical protein
MCGCTDTTSSLRQETQKHTQLSQCAVLSCVQSPVQRGATVRPTVSRPLNQFSTRRTHSKNSVCGLNKTGERSSISQVGWSDLPVQRLQGHNTRWETGFKKFASSEYFACVQTHETEPRAVTSRRRDSQGKAHKIYSFGWKCVTWVIVTLLNKGLSTPEFQFSQIQKLYSSLAD